MQIEIPNFLKLYNSAKVDGMWVLDGMDKVESQGRPADCVGCGACMGHCPQEIQIPKIMEEMAAHRK